MPNKTDETVIEIIEAPSLEGVDLTDLSEELLTDDKIDQYISNLDISAEAKLIISNIAQTSLRVGQHVVRVGKKIIEIVMMLAQKYPNTAFGAILGYLISVLISQIPILGVLGTALAPLLVALGLTMGFIEDFQHNSLARKVSEATAMFAPLKKAEV